VDFLKALYNGGKQYLTAGRRLMSNHTAAARLFSAIGRGRVPHAILIAGPEGSDACALARRAAARYCLDTDDTDKLSACPDYIELGPGAIPVNAVRAMEFELGARSQSGRRAVTLLEAHTMEEGAQNALLKTLEEPPANTIFLLAGLEAGLLPTIRSRCAILRLGAEPEEELIRRLAGQGVPAELARLGARLSEGAPQLAVELAASERQAFYREAVDLFFQTLLSARTPPYAAMAELVGTPVAPPEERRKQTEEKRLSARYCLRIWQALCLDAIHICLGLDDMLQNPGEAVRLSKAAGRFTISGLQGIMDLILSAQSRVLTANPALTMDALITGLCAYGG
jgi:hypothetical protein